MFPLQRVGLNVFSFFSSCLFFFSSITIFCCCFLFLSRAALHLRALSNVSLVFLEREKASSSWRICQRIIHLHLRWRISRLLEYSFSHLISRASSCRVSCFLSERISVAAAKNSCFRFSSTFYSSFFFLYSLTTHIPIVINGSRAWQSANGPLATVYAQNKKQSATAWTMGRNKSSCFLSPFAFPPFFFFFLAAHRRSGVRTRVQAEVCVRCP